MRAVRTLGTINAAVLLVAVGVAMGEHPAQPTAQVALAAPDKSGQAAERAYDAGPPAARRATVEDDEDEEQQHEPRTTPPDTTPPEMGRAAEVVAACESGKRRAHGTPLLGTHRWHITNDHGGTDSGAFQFSWKRSGGCGGGIRRPGTRAARAGRRCCASERRPRCTVSSQTPWRRPAVEHVRTPGGQPPWRQPRDRHDHGAGAARTTPALAARRRNGSAA